ncbi:MAG: dTDP-4-dehydrorhamnose 3,5-epimerase [Acidimicrobiia bacterium]
MTTHTPTDIPDVVRIQPTRHGDHRGFFSETFRSEWFPVLTFVQDNHSMSAEVGTLRGLHLQKPPRAQAKLVRVTRGAILDVVVDIRAGSPTFGHHVAVELSAQNWEQILVPVGVAHGFITREPNTEVLYKVTEVYSAQDEVGIAWDDPDIGIDWEVEPAEVILSDRDRGHPRLSELPQMFTYPEAH